jgi:hypothetical protein
MTEQEKLDYISRNFVLLNGERAWSKFALNGGSLPFLVNTEEITFYATPKFGLITADFNLEQTGKREL